MSDPKELKSLKERWKADLRALEIWTIKSGRKYGQPSVWRCKPTSLRDANYNLAIPAGLDSDTSQLAKSLQMGVHDIVTLAAQYAPWLLETFERVITDVANVLAEIPTLLKEAKLRLGFDGPVKRLNHRINILIQFSSTLAYVTSQCFGGCPAIATNPCLVAPHSLLGTGTAYQALSRFAGYIERVFEVYPVTSVIARRYAASEGFDIPDGDAKAWTQRSVISIDNGWNECSAEPIQHKVVYFSSRLGFGEFHYHVTAAAQALYGADSARWSLMTLSHEMMHAHVSGLLAAIFRTEATTRMTEDVFRTYVESLSSTTPPAASGGRVFIDSLREYICRYSIEQPVLARMAKEAEAGDSGRGENRVKAPSTPHEAAEAFRAAFRFMNEVFVHVLDLFYVYNGDQDTYLDLLWESWMTVPAVVDNVRDYALRSLVAVGALEDGNPLETPFTSAMRRLRSSLVRADARESGAGFFRRVLEFLDQHSNVAWLRVMFVPNFYLAKLTLRFLSSHKVQAKLSGNDQNQLVSDEGAVIYDIETGAFSGVIPNNPVAFLRDRLRRLSVDAEDELSEEYRTAWAFLVVSASTCEVAR